MESTVLFNSESDNTYLYDSNCKELLNIHPIIRKIHILYKNMSKYEVLHKLILENSKTYQDIDYYYKKYVFLRKNGFFKKRNINYILSGKIDGNTVEYYLANCNNVVFQVTQQCNLKCKYCCYGDLYENVEFTGDKIMNFVTAKKVIDYMVKFWDSNINISYNNVVVIGFYGGEPLVNFELISDIVNYIKKLELSNQIQFKYSMTTNAMLLDKFMDFIVENNFSLLISLDGDEKQDSLRVDLHNKPTFKRVFSNIKKLQKKYPNYFNEQVQFNAVLNSFSTAEEVFSYINDEFGKFPSIETIASLGVKYEKLKEFEEIYKSYQETSFMRDLTDDSRLRKVRDLGYFFYYHLRNTYRHYSELLMSDSKVTKIPTGTCIPFMKKLFVSSSGELLVCERIGLDKVVGSVNENVNIDFADIAEKYNKLYDSISKQCKKCYFAEFCSACIFQLPYKNNVPVCTSMYSEQDLQGYMSDIVSFLETNESKFTVINKAVFA